jgi:hypothetical protein
MFQSEKENSELRKEHSENPPRIPPQKIFAHQLITVDDLVQFKKQLVEELLIALRSEIDPTEKK